MANVHFYIGIENLALNTNQKSTLVTALRVLGPASHPQPSHLNHWRTRLDNEALIMEALFDEDNLTITAFKQRLANIFGIAVESINHSTTNHSFAGGTTPVVTFSHSGTDYLRMALFGGVDATWRESGDEVRGYLSLNIDLWESEVD